MNMAMGFMIGKPSSFNISGTASIRTGEYALHYLLLSRLPVFGSTAELEVALAAIPAGGTKLYMFFSFDLRYLYVSRFQRC